MEAMQVCLTLQLARRRSRTGFGALSLLFLFLTLLLFWTVDLPFRPPLARLSLYPFKSGGVC